MTESPEAATTSMEENHQPASARLPAELRLEIWKHYTAVACPTFEMRIFVPRCDPHEPALLRTCKLFRREALPLYLEELEKPGDEFIAKLIDARTPSQHERAKLSLLALVRGIEKVERELDETAE